MKKHYIHGKDKRSNKSFIEIFKLNKRRLICKRIAILLFTFIGVILSLLLPCVKVVNADSGFTLKSEVNLGAANGKGGVDLDWTSGIDPTNKTFMLYQLKEGSSEWQSISTVNFTTWMEPIHVLNIYPTADEVEGTDAGIPMVNFTFADGSTARMKKSAALKVWMEGGTMAEDNGNVVHYDPYGINPKTGQQLIYVDLVAFKDFNRNPNMAYSYDVIMFGTWDNNGIPSYVWNREGDPVDVLTPDATKVVEQYIQQGYGVCSGHDTIGDELGSYGLSGLRRYFNIRIGQWYYGWPGIPHRNDIDYQDSWGYVSNQVRVDKKGLLTNFPWELPLGTILNIPAAHTCANAALGDVWMNFTNGSWWADQTPNGSYIHEGNGTYYLTTWNNTAMIQTGHSMCESTPDERKILANMLFYLKQRTNSTSVTDNSSQDFAAPDAPALAIKETTSDGYINVSTHSDDNGSTYSFYAEAHQADDYFNGPIIRSNTTTETVTTGVARYYWVLDDNPTNDFDIANAHGETTSEVIKLSGLDHDQWLHVRAIDVAGNIGPVSDIKIEVCRITSTIDKTATSNAVNESTGNPVITKFRGAIEYTINYNVTVEFYQGKVTVSIVDQLPEEIDVNKSELDGGTYNSQDKTITWNYEIANVDAFSNEVNLSYTLNLKLYYTNISDTDKNLENTVIGHASTYKNNNVWRETEAKDSQIVEQNYITKAGGIVWLDNDRNGEYGDEGDTPMQGMTVKLHQNNNNSDTVIAETTTNEEGSYLFSNLDGTLEYYVEFVYNGQYYQPTKYKVGSAEKCSKGVDKITERRAFNDKFYQINSSPQNYSGGTVYTREELFSGGYIDKYGNPTENSNQFVTDSMISAYTGYNQNDNFYINYYPSEEADQEYPQYAESDEINSYINQGFIPRETSDLAINQDIQNVKLTINGNTQNYQYAKRENVYEVTDKLRNYYDKSYTREIYREDYFYQGTNALEIDVTYKIGLRNNSESITMVPTEIVDYYDTDYSLKNYDVKDSNGNSYNNLLTFTETSNFGSNSSISGYKKIYITSNGEIQMQPYSEITIYLTFSVNKEYDLLLIDNAKANIVEITCYRTYYTDLSFIPNEGNSKTQQEFSPGDKAGIIDIDSTPGNIKTQAIESLGKEGSLQGLSVTQLKDTYGIEDDSDIAPSIKFTYKGTSTETPPDPEEPPTDPEEPPTTTTEEYTRVLSGTVWEDTRDQTSGLSLIGDGILNDTPVPDVIVELIDIKASTERGEEVVATILNGNSWEEARTKSDSNGNYEFKGFIPSEYVVKFIYGAETNGEGIVKYNGQDYKSTLYHTPTSDSNSYNVDQPDSDDYIYNLRQADRENNPENYSDITDKTKVYYSDARDIMSDTSINNSSAYYKYAENSKDTGTRQYVNNYSNNYGNGVTFNLAQELKNTTTNTFMIAKTGKITVNIEYDRTESETSSTGANNVGSNNYQLSAYYKMPHIDFGLVQRPKAQIKLTKQIINVKVFLANGNTLFDASSTATNALWINHMAHGPDQDNLYTKDLNYNSNQSMKEPTVRTESSNKGRIQLTMDTELMHGATMKITYAITAANIGEVDYNGNQFYYYGTAPTDIYDYNSIVKTIPKTIIDYVGTQIHEQGSVDDESATRNNLQFSAEENSEYNWSVISIDEIFDNNLIDRNLENQVKKYSTIIQTNALEKELIPILADETAVSSINTYFDTNPMDTIDYVNTTNSVVGAELVLSQMITPDNDSDDMIYNNMVELVKSSNTAGRRMEYSVVGNQDPTLEPQEIDADTSQEVTILPPFGQTNTYYWLGVVIAIILIAGIILVIKVLKK